MRDLLANRTYASLLAAQVVALLGTGLLTVALGLLAYDIAGGDAGVVLGTALTIKMAAYVGVSPVMAALTARISRTRLLVSADAVRAAAALSLPFVHETWHIYALVFVLQAASATFTPAFQAVIPAVVPDEAQYTRALSLSRLAYDLESLLSPALAALLLTLLTYSHLFLGTVAGFVLSATLVLAARLPAVTTPPATPFLDRLTRGTRIFLRLRPLRALLALDLAVSAATAFVIVDTVVLVRGRWAYGEAAVAALLACYGAGSMLVALALPRVLDRLRDRTVLLTGAAALPCVLVAMAGVTASGEDATAWTAAAALWLLAGAAVSLVLTPAARLLRREVAAADHPAVFAARFSLSHACFALTYPAAGLLGARLGPPITALVLAALAAAAGTIAAAAWRPTRCGARLTRV